MSNVLAVFGATGQQGSSVIRCVQDDPQLTKKFKIRGITRDVTKLSSKTLQKNDVEMVEASADDAVSLVRALKGCHTVFVITATIFDEKSKAREIAQGKVMADAAVSVGAEFLIFSSLPSVTEISHGKYKHVYHFDAKAEVESYIRTLPIKSSFIAPGSFMQNFRDALAPRPAGDGTYAIFNCMAPETQLPLVDVADTGKWVATILTEPTKYEGKFIAAAVKLYSLLEIVALISKASGKVVKYKQIPENDFRRFLPKMMADDLVDMANYFQNFGYYGPKMKEIAGLASQCAHWKLTTFEEYLVKEPLTLE